MPNQGFQFSAIGGVGINPQTVIGSPRADLGGGGVNGWYGYGVSGYDATRHRPRHRRPLARTLSEDQELRQYPRRQLSSATRDLIRNFSAAAFALRCHLDNTSTFHFRSNTNDRGLDKQIDEWMRWWSLPQNCDQGARHSLSELVRMWEALRSLDGDCLINRLRNGRVQTIESDRIQTDLTPFAELGIEDPRKVINGVWIDDYGRPKAYMVFNRELWNLGLIWDRMIPAKFADLHGYWLHRYDQVRGITPMASAATTFQDLYKNFEYALRKSGLSQFAGLLFTRAGSESLEGIIGRDRGDETEPEPTPGTDSDTEPRRRYEVDVDDGLFSLDLDQGDDAKLIESQTPSNQFQDFSKMMLMMSLKAFDIPYSFFDESFTNFAGQQQAKIRYGASAKIKQRQNRQLLDKLTRWRLGLAVYNDEISLPEGMTVDDLKWEWHHQGQPDYNEMQKAMASIAKINAGTTSLLIEAKEQGFNAYELIDQKADIEAYARKKGVILSTALPSAASTDPDKSTTQKEDVSQEESDDGKNQENI